MRLSTKRRASVALAALAGLIATLGIGASAAVAQSSAIEGVITDEGTGAPVTDACVAAYDQDFNFGGVACVDASGHYVIEGLEAGVGYRLQVFPFDDHVGEWAFHKSSFDAADVIVAPAVVDIPLRLAERIEGTVTAADSGELLAGVCVDAWFADTGDFVDSQCTDVDGRYALRVAPGFEYRLQANGTEEFAGEWAFDKAFFEEADRVTPPAVVDFALDRVSRFTGTLTMPDGYPPSFAQILVVSAVEPEDIIDSVVTDENGQWSIAVPPGDYKIQAVSEPFVRWALDAPDFASADVLNLGPGQVVTVDIRFAPLGHVTGRVVDASSDEPVAGICIRLTDPDGANPAGDQCTGADGRYTVDVSEGRYTVHFNSEDGKYVSEWFRNQLREQDAEFVFVGSGATVRANARLAPGAKVTGRLVDPATDAPLSDLCVSARNPKTLEFIESQRDTGACSDADGRYTIAGLPTGSILLFTGGDRNLRPPAWAPGVPTAAMAKRYSVESGETTHAGRFRIPIGGIVRGRVTNQNGEPLAGIVFTPTGAGDRSGEGPTAVTDANGEYQLAGVSLAPIVPGVFDPSGTYGWQWMGGAADRTQATPVTLQSGQTTTRPVIPEVGSGARRRTARLRRAIPRVDPRPA